MAAKERNQNRPNFRSMAGHNQTLGLMFFHVHIHVHNDAVCRFSQRVQESIGLSSVGYSFFLRRFLFPSIELGARRNGVTNFFP